MIFTTYFEAEVTIIVVKNEIYCCNENQYTWYVYCGQIIVSNVL